MRVKTQDYINSAYEKQAYQRLKKSVYHYFAGGAENEITLRENIAIFDRIKLCPRVLNDIDNVDMSSNILSQTISAPILIAPMAFQKLAHVEGELATAQAVSKHNIIMSVSTYATSSFRDIAQVSKNPPWFQLYFQKDRSVTRQLILNATLLNYSAIVITVDAPIYGRRVREEYFPIELPHIDLFKNLSEAGLSIESIHKGNLAEFLKSQLDTKIAWKDIEWVRSLTSLPIILKGILHPKDLQIAQSMGIETIILSNHGGRQLDTAITAVEVLRFIDDQFKTNLTLIVDGGIRKGTDILKVMALGARAVMIGRPILWGLACLGEQGVFNVIEELKQDLERSMKLCGIKSLSNITPDILKWTI